MQAEARAEGHRMLDTLAADWAAGTTRFDGDGEALLVAYSAGRLAGIAGITKDPVVPNALRMRRFYVRASHRRDGLGRALALELLDPERRRGRVVTVNAGTGSEAFWQALGFVRDLRDGHTHVLPTDASPHSHSAFPENA